MERKQSGQGNGDGGTECSEGQKPQGKGKGQPGVCTELGPGAGETFLFFLPVAVLQAKVLVPRMFCWPQSWPLVTCV